MEFLIAGYWKDDKSEIEDCIVTDWDGTPEGYEDDDIFYYGLNEEDFQESCEEDGLEFVVTEFRKINMNKTAQELEDEFYKLRRQAIESLLEKAITPIDFSKNFNDDDWFDLPQQSYVDKYEYHISCYIYKIEFEDTKPYFVGTDLQSGDDFHFAIDELDTETIIQILKLL